MDLTKKYSHFKEGSILDVCPKCGKSEHYRKEMLDCSSKKIIISTTCEDCKLETVTDVNLRFEGASISTGKWQ